MNDEKVMIWLTYYLLCNSSETKCNSKHITEDSVLVDLRNGIIQTDFSKFFFFFWPCNLLDLSSPTRDRTCTLSGKSTES